MRCAIVENGTVVNVILAEAPDEALGWIACPDEVSIGWSYVDGEFSPPPAPSPEEEPPT